MRSTSTLAALLFAAGLLAAPVPFPKPDRGQSDAKRLLGVWDRLSCTAGSFPPVHGALSDQVTITEGKIVYSGGPPWDLTIGFEKGKKTWDIRQGGNHWTGLYELKGDTLRVNFLPSNVRPASVEPSKSGEYLQTFRRAAPKP